MTEKHEHELESPLHVTGESGTRQRASQRETFIALVGAPYASYSGPDGSPHRGGADGVLYVPKAHAKAMVAQHGLAERDGKTLTREQIAAEQLGTPTADES